MAIINLGFDPDKFSTIDLLYRTDTKLLFSNTGTFDVPVYTAVGSGIVESTEQNFGHTAKSSGTSSTNSRKYGESFTVPSTSKYIQITDLEVDWQGTTGQNVQCGVDIVDALVPVSAYVKTISLTPQTAQSAANVKQKIPVLFSELIPAGTIIKPWVNSPDITNIGMVASQPSENASKSITFSENPDLTDITAWGAATERMFVEIYYIGFS